MNDASLFREIRSYASAVYFKYNFNRRNALNAVTKKFPKMKKTMDISFQAELLFFDEFRKRFKPLVWGLDAEDKTDFSGNINGLPSRVDVTTNIEYKQIEDYEEFIYDEEAFWIANVNLGSEEIELIPPHFPKCRCDDGIYYNLIYLEPHKYGTIITDSIDLIQYCIYCRSTVESQSANWVVQTFNGITEYYDEQLKEIFQYNQIDSQNDKIFNKEKNEVSKELSRQIMKNGSEIANLARKEFFKSISWIGQPEYDIIHPPSGDGDNITRIYWSNKYIEDVKEIPYYSGEVSI